MEDTELIRVKSYSKVWRIERFLYAVGGRNLPFPVAIKAIMYFIAFTFILKLNIPPFNWVPFRDQLIYSYGVPAGLAYFFSKQLLDGKNPLLWLKSITIHFIRWVTGYNTLNRYKRVPKSEKAQYTNRIAYRVVYQIEE